MDTQGMLALVQKAAKPLFNIVKVTGPFVLAQSKTAVENYSDYKLNKARLDAISVLLQEEAKNISNDRAKLRDKIINSTGMERVRAQNDYNLLTQELNKLSTVDMVKNFITDDETINTEKEIEDSWIYKFNQLASSLNEDWRKQLLANAFALELKNPGSINFIMLNCIASFDETTFRMFGFLINSSIRMYEVNILPPLEGKREFEINGETCTINKILYGLEHLNLIKGSNDGYIDMSHKVGEDTLLRYGKRVLRMRYPEAFIPAIDRIGMNYFTQLGNDIAKLYTREINDFGDENFETFVKAAKDKNYIWFDFELSDSLYLELGN
jgi:hypothetical protein